VPGQIRHQGFALQSFEDEADLEREGGAQGRCHPLQRPSECSAHRRQRTRKVHSQGSRRSGEPPALFFFRGPGGGRVRARECSVVEWAGLPELGAHHVRCQRRILNVAPLRQHACAHVCRTEVCSLHALAARWRGAGHLVGCADARVAQPAVCTCRLGAPLLVTWMQNGDSVADH